MQGLKNLLQWIDNRIKTDNKIPQDIINKTVKILYELNKFSKGALAAPDCGLGENGEIILIWKNNIHYLSIEINHDSLLKWFFRNSRTWEIFGENNDNLPANFIDKLKIFYEKN